MYVYLVVFYGAELKNKCFNTQNCTVRGFSVGFEIPRGLKVSKYPKLPVTLIRSFYFPKLAKMWMGHFYKILHVYLFCSSLMCLAQFLTSGWQSWSVPIFCYDSWPLKFNGENRATTYFLVCLPALWYFWEGISPGISIFVCPIGLKVSPFLKDTN